MKLNELFAKNLSWKVMSLVLAVILWFLVINIENPVETRPFNIKVDLLNADIISNEGLVISNENAIENLNVVVKVKGNRLSLEELGQRRSEISASADFSKIVYTASANNIVTVPIEVKLPNISSIEVVSREPSYISLQLEEIAESQISIEVVTTGSLGDDFISLSPTVAPEAVTVTGAESAIEKIEQAIVNVDLNYEESDIQVTVTPKFYDANQKEIVDVEPSIKEVTVSIPIRKVKTIPFDDILVQGIPEEGYTIYSISTNINEITVAGTVGDINSIHSFSLPVINVEGATETQKAEFSITDLLPDGIILTNASPKAVTVTVEINREFLKEIDISSNDLNITGNLDAGMQLTILPETVTVTLKGEEDILSAISGDSLSKNINIDGLQEGEHNLPIALDLPEDITIVGESPSVHVIVSRAAPVAENMDPSES